MESLQALVLRRAKEIGGREGELSNRALARRNGADLSHTLISQIINGEYANRAPDQRVLDGLAKALEVPLETVESAAGAPPSYGPFKLPDDAARLTPAQRKAVRHVVQVMIDSNEAGSAALQETSPAEVTPLRRVASGRPRKAQPERETAAERRAREAASENPDAPKKGR
jgi:transcriptional regulator with XRE-family HTH domain